MSVSSSPKRGTTQSQFLCIGHQSTPPPEQYTEIMFTIWYYTRYIFTWDTDIHVQDRKGSRGSPASSYRPVTLSVVMTKILELYIFEVCQTHTPHSAQFGFVDGRGTYMAISLAHDVMAYFNDCGSAVYTCSLDAEGAFDAIPHVVIFGKLDGIVPDYAWRVMYAWYRQMYVTIRLHGALGQILSVRRGTRQGGLSSPRIFNVFYGDLIDTISKSDRGISLRGETYSVFCYTDDLLIASTTSTGSQTLRDLCDSYPSTDCGSTLRKQAAPL